MSKDKRHLRPWWRRRRWPLACGVVGVVLATISFLSCWRVPFLNLGGRVMVTVAGARVYVLILDKRMAQYVAREMPYPPAGLRQFSRATDGVHPFMGWEAHWSEEVTDGIRNPGRIMGRQTTILMSLGYLVLFFAFVSSWGFLRLWLWRDAPGYCPKCNYDLTGLAFGSKCPECGKPGTITSPAPEKS